MALIGTIRKNSWILIVLIAVGMGGFILQSVVQGGQKYAAGDAKLLGKVNGEKIDREEFEKAERVLFPNSSAENMYKNKATLWNYFKNKALSKTLAEDLGLGVSTEELLELEFGQNLSPIIVARFKDPKTGRVDRQSLDKIRQAIDEGNLAPEYVDYWAVQEKEIITDRLITKITNLVAKALYTPSWYAKVNYNLDESSADFNYVKVPFDKIPDDEVEVTDDAIREYLKKHKKLYTNDVEKRVVKYIVIDVKPTDKDVKAIEKEASALVDAFKTSTNDSLFAINHGGMYTNVYYKLEDLPEPLKNDSLYKGKVIGPYKDKDKFTVAKVSDIRMVPDSVSAKHILRKADPQNPDSYVQAKAFIDSLKTLLEEGKANFDSLAVKYSQDPGSASKGGDLGTFAQGRMVPSFNNACFFGDKDKYHIVNSRYGVHLIKIEKQIYNDKEPKYKVAYATKSIIPSEETQDSLYEVVSELLTENESMDSLEAYAKKNNYEIKKSIPLKADDYTFMSLGSGQTARKIIKWAFDENTSKGDIAGDVFTFKNNKDYYNEKYVIAMLEDIYPKGLKSVDEARKEIEMLVKNHLKGLKIVEQISNPDLNTVASQFNVPVDTAKNVKFKTTFVPKLGNEPKVISYVFNGEKGKDYGPTIGNAGCYVVRANEVFAPAKEPDILNLKKTMTQKIRGEITYKLLDEIAKNVKIVDRRNIFY